MVEQQEQSGVAVRHSIVVEAPQDRAFTVFTRADAVVVADGVAHGSATSR